MLLQTHRDRRAFAVILPADEGSAAIRAFRIAGVTAFLPCCDTLEDAQRLIDGDPLARPHQPRDMP